MKIETKTYADGAVATGVAPLPDRSPAEQNAGAIEMIACCGKRRVCTSGDEHDFSGWEDLPEGAGTAVCSRCGHRAIDDAMWMDGEA
jgi:hypothetical protein